MTAERDRTATYFSATFQENRDGQCVHVLELLEVLLLAQYSLGPDLKTFGLSFDAALHLGVECPARSLTT